MRPTTTRRDFLKQAAAITAPLFVPATALGLQEKAAASERIAIGVIGAGGRGRGLLNQFMNEKDVQVVAICDVDLKHRKQAQDAVHRKYSNQDCTAHGDFRELLGRKDIDAVIVATPDHWHALAAIHAAQEGKDIYCEKPLVNSIGEGRALCDAVKKHNRVLQTGSQERSGDRARFACELVRNGLIGKLETVRVNLPCSDGHHQQVRAVKDMPDEMPVPEGFDYNFWLGHTPVVPYTEKRCHFFWRFILAYGGGEMTDRGAHVIDLAQLGMGTDDTGPVEIEARGVRQKGSLYDVFWDYEFTNVYPNGVKLIGSAKTPRGVRFEGTDGWIFIHVHGQKLEASKPEVLETKTDDLKIRLGRSPDGANILHGHIRSFLDSVKSRKQPTAHAEIGHRTASVCHLNNIAMTLGRKLRWDPMQERFDDDEANKLITPVMRSPWRL